MYGNIDYGMYLWFPILYLISFLWDANSEKLYTMCIHLLMRYTYSFIFCITFLTIYIKYKYIIFIIIYFYYIDDTAVDK